MLLVTVKNIKNSQKYSSFLFFVSTRPKSLGHEVYVALRNLHRTFLCTTFGGSNERFLRRADLENRGLQ